MFSRLRNRIIVFFVALLAVVQVAAFVLVSSANSTNARAKIESELKVGERVFARLLEQNREQLSQTARVMAADYGLRESIASHDLGTIISALKNHGDRINADVTMLVSMDNEVIADTFAPEGSGRPFEFPKLIESARQDGSASAIEITQDHAYQLVVVPVLAPVPIAWIALGFQVDDALAQELKQLTALDISFLEGKTDSRWHILASTLQAEREQLIAALPALPTAIDVAHIGSGNDEQQVRVLRLNQYGNQAVAAVLQRSVAQAVTPFERLKTTLVVLGVISVLFSIFACVVIASSITRPLSQLSKAALRIEEGDYSQDVQVGRLDEIGLLAKSLNHMREGIATREQEILRLAYRDTLTNLPNRSLFNDRLQHAIATAQRAARCVTVLVMDLDRFKYVNDTLGHSVGDHVLREVAVRLQSVLRQSDTVARLGGDEFAVLLESASEADALRVAAKVSEALEAPIAYAGQPLDVGTSIGIAAYPQHGADAGVLLRNADIAMYVAKRNKSGFAVYDPEYDTHQQEHLSLLSEIRRAVEQNELRVYYQPKVVLATSAAVAVEALIRWQHPQRGLIPPIQFIPFAEHTGFIKVLTRWVLEESIRQCGVWRKAGISLRVSVNISTRDLLNRDLPEIIRELLDKYETPAHMICLEITESGFMEDPAHAQKVLDRLHALGVHLSIDDYGTGYSSLSYIARLPVDELKIDRSFIKHMTTDDVTSAIVRSTIELGHSLGLKVVAEGVEDDAGFKMLRELGCDQAQGYFMSPPVPAAELERWLRESSWGKRAFAERASNTSRLSALQLIKSAT